MRCPDARLGNSRSLQTKDSGHDVKRNRRVTTAHGFTLLEVMVAVAITGTAIVMLLHAHSASIHLYELTREMVVVQHLSRQLIAELEVSGYPDIADEEGDVSDVYPGFSWRRTCNKLGDDWPGVYEVTIIITGPVEEYMIVTHLMEDTG